MNAFLRKLSFLTIILVSVLWTAGAWAGSVTLQLVRNSLTTVDDPASAGRWGHEGGDVKKGGVVIGQYLITRRMTFPATSKLNTAATTITLFFTPAVGVGRDAPENITLQGAHDFSSGKFKGSVSGASNRYTWVQGADAVYNNANSVENLTISWTGANQLTVP